MKTNNVSALFMTLIIAVSLIGAAYAHWSDTIRIEGTVEMAHILIDITSQKVLMSPSVQKYSSFTYEVSPDKHTLTIYSKNLKPCWYIWVGLVLQNKGTLPGKIKAPTYSFQDDYGFGAYFETKEYFYGPYPESTGFGTLEEWGRVKIDQYLKSDGSVTFTTPSTPTPFTLNPTEKAIMWIWIHVIPDVPPTAMGKTVTLTITITDDLDI